MLPMCPSSQSKSKVDEILAAIRNHSDLRTNEDWKDVNDDYNLLTLYNKLISLNSKEFSLFEEKICLFLLNEWETTTNRCFRTLEFVADLLSAICTVINVDIVLEYLKWFSQPSMPPHIHLFIYPAILTVANQRCPNRFKDEMSFLTMFEQYMLKCEKADTRMSSNELFEFSVFWKASLKFYLSNNFEDFETKLLAAVVKSHLYLRNLAEVDEYRMMMLVSLMRCLKEKPSETSILVSTLFLTSLTTVQFNEKSWNEVTLYLKMLHTTVSKCDDKPLQNFYSIIIESFFKYAQVPNSDCVSSLKTMLEISNEKNVQVRSTHTSHQNEKTISNGSTTNSTTQHNPSSDATTTEPLDKYLGLLEKLVKKMQDASFEFSDSHRKRFNSILNDLNKL